MSLAPGNSKKNKNEKLLTWVSKLIYSLPWVEKVNKHPEKQHKSAEKQELRSVTADFNVRIPSPHSHYLPNGTWNVHHATSDSSTLMDVSPGKDTLTDITGRMNLCIGLLTTDQNLKVVGKKNNCLMWWSKCQNLMSFCLCKPAQVTSQPVGSRDLRFDPVCSGSQMTTARVTMTWLDPAPLLEHFRSFSKWNN